MSEVRYTVATSKQQQEYAIWRIPYLLQTGYHARLRHTHNNPKFSFRRARPAERSEVSAYDAQDDALRLLRAINMEQAHGRVGSLVFAFAAARSVGLQPGTERYEEALWRLVWEGALTVAEHVPPEIAARLPFGRTPYRLTPAAVRLLEMA